MMIKQLASRILIRPRFGLAVLALALVATGGGVARQADAQASGSMIQVTFQSISFPKLNDCNWLESNCNTADLYGKVTAVSNGGSSGGRLLAKYWDTEKAWEDPSCGIYCLKLVHQGDVKLFMGTRLCTMTSAFQPQYQVDPSSCQQNNHSFVITASAGQTITVSSSLWDHDAASADDPVCVASKQIPLTQASLVKGATGTYTMSQSFNGYGSCTITVTLTTL